MAKNQYLEAQGFGDGGQQVGDNTPTNIQGTPAMGGMNQNMDMGRNAMNNQSGYPVSPTGYDQYNNPYWMDPATGQASYTPPTSGLGLGKMIQKGAAWAKWLA